MNEQLQLWNSGAPLHNVFFAVRLDAEMAARIARMGEAFAVRSGWKGKLLPPERLHISLCKVGEFHGGYPPALINEAKAIAGTVAMAPFKVAFDRVASFGGGNGTRAIVLTGGEGVAGLVRLRQALGSALRKAGMGPRRMGPFTPHLTMMYADCACDFVIEPMSWMVHEFALIDSLYGQSRHELLGRWPR